MSLEDVTKMYPQLKEPAAPKRGVSKVTVHSFPSCPSMLIDTQVAAEGAAGDGQKCTGEGIFSTGHGVNT